MPMPPMDSAYASVMREEGISINEIRKELARRDARKMPYTYNAVCTAIARFNKLLEVDDASPK